MVFRPRNVAIGALIACGLAVSPPAAQAEPLPARSAADFTDSVGVNTHLSYDDTPYRSVEVVKQKLSELGVRHVRDAVGQGRPDVYAGYRSLAAAGIRLDFIIGDPLQRWGIGSLEQQLDLVRREFPGAVASIEGPNEFDISGASDWRGSLVDYQQRLHAAVKSDPALRHLPVVGPSFVHRESQVAVGNIGAHMDLGNVHPYPGGRAPDLDSHLSDQLSRGALNAGSKPLMATETGYHNAVGTADGHRPASESAAGVYLPRLYLDYFRRGFSRTFAYELIDSANDSPLTNPEASFGLVRKDLSEKPAFTALKRLMSLLADPARVQAPGTLDVSVSGAPASLRQALLQKSDGSYYLALWTASSIWDQDRAQPLAADRRTATVTLGATHAEVSLYRPSTSSDAVETWSAADRVNVEIGPDVAVLKLTGITSPAGPVPSTGTGSTPGSGGGSTPATGTPPAPATGTPPAPAPGTPAPAAGTAPAAGAPSSSMCASHSKRHRRPPVCYLRADERRIVSSLKRLRGDARAAASKARRRNREARVERWLRLRAAAIRRRGLRSGWQRHHRRIRYRYLTRVVRAR